MKIGELAQATDTPAATIRFYEREGLMPAAARSAANYRHYGPAHVQRLALIRRCRGLDCAWTRCAPCWPCGTNPPPPATR